MAEGAAGVCVCVLFYGSDDTCFKLAQRVLNAPMRELTNYPVEFRFGCNAVGHDTKAFLQEQMASVFTRATLFESAANAHKYPMMRRMFYEHPISAPIVVWFDDDSCFAPDTDISSWLPRLTQQLAFNEIVGSIYKTRLEGNQSTWIKAQPWYAGKEPQAYVQFPAGSWWAAQTATLHRFNWPPNTTAHKGVDVMLGELCRQQELAIGHFRDGVWINANADGIEAAGSKRGKHETPIGFDYQP